VGDHGKEEELMDDTIIAWTDHTFNPWIGCSRVSAGCKHCYAERLVTTRMGREGLWGATAARMRTSAAYWRRPSRWQAQAEREGRTRMVFCGSLCDVFEDHPDVVAVRRDLWELIRRTPNLIWQLLTKRPENVAGMLPSDWGSGWPNVWLGTSIEDERVLHRRDALVANPAVVHFVSWEPALGPLDGLDLDDVEWVIAGGESGPGYRPFDHAWARRMRDRCRERGVAFFFKQSAAPRTETGIRLDGEIVREWPTVTPVTLV
jgi:protein gp37